MTLWHTVKIECVDMLPLLRYRVRIPDQGSLILAGTDLGRSEVILVAL